jgi:hypothetical protein
MCLVFHRGVLDVWTPGRARPFAWSRGGGIREGVEQGTCQEFLTGGNGVIPALINANRIRKWEIGVQALGKRMGGSKSMGG